VAIETNVAVLPFGVVLAYVIVLNSPIKTKCPITTQFVMLDLNAYFDYTTTNIF
jgi:hypothetical protein